MEQHNLTIPEQPPANTYWRVTKISFNWDGAHIGISLKGTNGEILVHNYSGDVATTLMRQMNTLNFSTTSMHKRLLLRLAADGVIEVGTISGVPD